MAEVSQSAEIETSCDVSIAIQNDPTSMEQGTMPEQKILKVPHQLLKEMVEVSQLTETDTSGQVSIAIQNDRPSLEQNLILAWPSQKILKVPRQLLEVNRKAYEPYVISIGPYHRCKDHLKEMEEQKVPSLKRLLQSTNQSVEIYLSAIGDMVKEARNCYSGPLDISEEEFIEMMVLDGCFIILFFTGMLGDSFCCNGLIYSSILHDLVLVENQLPFFVLYKLFDMIPKTFFNLVGSTDPKNWFIHQLLEKFEDRMPGLRVNTTYDDSSMKNVKHIVHLLHSNWLPSNEAMDEYNHHPKDGKWRLIRSATELREAGIEFKRLETGRDARKSLFDIKFYNKILAIPTVTIDVDTESLLRNLIVFEQYDNKHPLFLTAYIALMDPLINSVKDVELLCKSGIIDNLLGNDESVAALFNGFGNHISFSRQDFFYAQLFKDINRYYGTPWSKWTANLRHKYFKTPSAFVSFLAATLLLLLTLLQTAFTIFPRP
ncbi:hypothetical protein SLEP1_g57447 [Rubroshorea leprosula]|uniref:Uncharacterized protein n=1 Tax=Rubroshorea leprosula TaxID=152421 RepID=A0AAV5ML97_9ROSI|nr:hypothetical protein SLEP1_g57447 [Rubroshorea leprosula]